MQLIIVGFILLYYILCVCFLCMLGMVFIGKQNGSKHILYPALIVYAD